MAYKHLHGEQHAIVNGVGSKEAIADRVAQIKAQIASTKSDYDTVNEETFSYWNARYYTHAAQFGFV